MKKSPSCCINSDRRQTCLLVNSNLCGKLLLRIIDDNLKFISVAFFSMLILIYSLGNLMNLLSNFHIKSVYTDIFLRKKIQNSFLNQLIDISK